MDEQQQQQQQEYEEDDQEEEMTDYSRLAGDANYSRIISSPLLFSSQGQQQPATIYAHNSNTSINSSSNDNNHVTMRSRR